MILSFPQMQLIKLEMFCWINTNYVVGMDVAT